MKRAPCRWRINRASRQLPPLVLVLGLAMAAAQGAAAQGIDMTQGGPIQVTARDGIEWRQADREVIANGDAHAVRGETTVTADRLIAWYREKPGAAQNAPRDAGGGVPGTAPAPPAAGSADPVGEGSEVYRMRAEGNVHIFTRTDEAWGDQATYDLDTPVMVMTGRGLKMTTPSDQLTARDSLEYWSDKRMAVARGDAVVVTSDGRRVSADTIVAYTAPPAPNGSGATGARSSVPGGARAAAPGADGTAALAGHLDKVEAFGNVTVRTATEIVTGDRAVYVPDTGMARLGGHVRITRGPNQLYGSEAMVNMTTGVATLLAGADGRVAGYVVPNDQSSPPLEGPAPSRSTPR